MPVAPPHISEADAVALFRSAPWAAQVRVNGAPVGGLVDEQIRIELTGSGEPSSRALVPQTKAAQQLLAGPDGPRISDALHGYLSMADGTGSQISGLSFATTASGLVVDHLISIRDELPFALTDHLSAGQIKQVQEISDGSFAFFTANPMMDESPAEMVFGPHVSQPFLQYAGGRGDDAPAQSQEQAFAAVRMMAHEIQHRITPVSDAELHKLGGAGQFFEEGRSELAVELPGVLDRVATAMGMPHPPSAYRGPWVYPQYVEALTRLLQRANLQVSDPEATPQIRQLLQIAPSTGLASRIATAIGTAHRLPLSAVDGIRSQITALGNSPGDTTSDYQQWSREFNAALTRRLATIDSLIAPKPHGPSPN